MGQRKLRRREITPSQQIQIEYWAALGARLEDRGSFLKPPAPQPRYVLNFPIGHQDCGIRAMCNLRNKNIGLELYVNDEIIYNELHARRNEIDKKVKNPLSWNSVRDQCTIKLIHQKYDPNDRKNWQKQHFWLIEHLELFHKVFSSVLKSL